MGVLADEGFSGIIVKRLREDGFVIDWVVELKPGIPDEEVIQFAKSKHKILLTEDKDFGEWVFAHRIKGLSIIFIRYSKNELAEIIESLRMILRDQKQLKTNHEFITITRNKIRRRKI